MANHKIISVTFEVDAQNCKDGQFSVPKKVCDFLEVTGDDNIKLEITSNSQSHKYETKLKSGNEIYGGNLAEYVKKGSRITVKISKI